VLSNQFESVSVDKVYVNFEQVGDQHFLTKIQTGDHLFTIPVSRKTIAAAAMNQATARLLRQAWAEITKHLFDNWKKGGLGNEAAFFCVDVLDSS